MLFQNICHKRLYKYLACFIIPAILLVSVPFPASAAIAAFLTARHDMTDSDTKIVLEWNPVAGAQMYRILRDDGNGFQPVGTIDPELELEATTFVDEGLTPDTTYSYQLKAYHDADMSSEIDLTANQASIRTTDMIRPDGLIAVYNINTRTVMLSWETASRAATGCVVRKNNENGPIVASAVDNPSKSIVFSIDETVPVSFVVITDDGAGHTSAASAPVTVTPVDPPAVTAEAVPGGKIAVSWGAFSQIQEFQLQRSRWNGTGWGSWEVINSSPAGTGTTDTPDEGGTYRYRLSAKANSRYAGYSSVSGSVACPKAPLNLQASIVNFNRIDLQWTNASGNESALKVERSQSGGSFVTLATLDKGAAGYTDNVPVQIGATYTYRITAWESDNNYSRSELINVTASVPEAPSNLTLTVNSRFSVTLNWKDNSSSEQSFVIERKTGSGTFTAIGTVNAGVTSYTDESLSEGKTYAYRVKAINALGESAYSNTLTIASDNIVMPNSLSVTAVSSSRIDLAWSYAGNGTYATIIERKTGTDGSWSVIAVTSPGTYTYSNTGLTANTRYFYRVRNYLGEGITTPSYPDNDTGIGAYTMLSGLSLSGGAVSGGRIVLEWHGATDGSQIVIERKMADGRFAVLATVNTSPNYWYDNTGLIPGVAYTYRIKAQNSINQSAYSNEVTVENIYLEAPTEFIAAPDSNQTVTLKWKDNSEGEMGFEIWRRIYNSDSSYELLDTVGPNVTSYTDKTAQPGVQYYYRIRAYLDGIYSSYSITQSTGIGIIAPPGNLRFTYVSDTSITLAWDDNSDNESGFKIERKVASDDKWVEIATVPSNTKSYKYTGLNPNVTYYFRVKAYRAFYNMDSFSNEIEVTTGKPKAPTEVSANVVSLYQARIKWKDNSNNETGFRIYRALYGITDYKLIATVGKDVTSYVDNFLSSGARYYYKVVAYNDSGESDGPTAELVTGTYQTFSDVSSSHWAYEPIVSLASRGIIKGKTNNLFKPDDTITRAEFTVLMIRAFNLDTTSPVGSFADVKIGKWYYNEVMIAENLGIVNGDYQNRFYPDDMITREDMAVIIVKTLAAVGKPLNAHGNSVLEKFWDKDMISPYALSGIATIVGEGIMTGLPGNSIAPKRTLTRAEAAAIIYRVLDR